MRILLVNVNTTTSITDALVTQAAAVARPTTEVVGLTPWFGPESVEGRYEAMLAATGVIDAVLAHPSTYDGVILAGFGEPGREALQELLEVPVIDITDAATTLACLVAPRFSIVTTTLIGASQIGERLRGAGLYGRCSSIRPTGLSVLDIRRDFASATQLVAKSARAAIDEDGCEAVILGCSAMSGMAESLMDELQLPVIDGTEAAVRLMESLIDMRLSIDKRTTFARPDRHKRIDGWPLTREPGHESDITAVVSRDGVATRSGNKEGEHSSRGG